MKDIRPGRSGSRESCCVGPESGLTVVGDAFYFATDDGANGTELWIPSADSVAGGEDMGTFPRAGIKSSVAESGCRERVILACNVCAVLSRASHSKVVRRSWLGVVQHRRCVE